MSITASSSPPLPSGGLPVVNQTLEPAWVRDGSAATQKAYQTALAFEQMLVEQLSQSLTATAASVAKAAKKANLLRRRRLGLQAASGAALLDAAPGADQRCDERRRTGPRRPDDPPAAGRRPAPSRRATRHDAGWREPERRRRTGGSASAERTHRACHATTGHCARPRARTARRARAPRRADRLGARACWRSCSSRERRSAHATCTPSCAWPASCAGRWAAASCSRRSAHACSTRSGERLGIAAEAVTLERLRTLMDHADARARAPL